MQFYRAEIFNRFRKRFERLYGEAVAGRCLNRLRMMIGRYGVGLNPQPVHEKWNQSTRLLITYAHMVQKDGEPPLEPHKRFCDKHLQSALSHVHILPFCPYSSDDGFSVIDYREVNPDFGTWENIEAIGEKFDLMFDLVLNHCSRRSAWFKQFLNGISPGRDYFVTAEKGTDVSQVTRPRTHPLLTRVQTRVGEDWVWTTFSADQVDVDFSNPDVLFEFLDILFLYISKGARIIRLDAIAYLWKKLGTNCIHLPETHEVVKLMRDVLEMVAPELLLLTETNVPHKENVSYFGDGDEANVVYQFTLPPLLLYTLTNGDATKLTEWAGNLGETPEGCTYLNFTASHDGIGVRPLEGLVEDAEVRKLADLMRARGGHVSGKTNPDGTESPYEMNITYFDALCENGEDVTDLDIERFLCSQTIPLALAGIPAVYFHSLTGTRNYYEGVKHWGYPRAINRMKWKEHDLEILLADHSTVTYRVFHEYTRRLKVRAEHPAFHPDGDQAVLELGNQVFAVERTAPGGTEMILAISNVTRDPIEIHLASQIPTFCGVTSCEHADVLNEEVIQNESVKLAPYQTRWIVVQRV